MWQGATQVRCTEVGDSTVAERFCGPEGTGNKKLRIFVCTQLHVSLQYLRRKKNVFSTNSEFTLQWKKHDLLSLMFSRSGHHSDSVVCVTLEVSEDGLSCCWVTELQGGLTASLRMVSDGGGVEAVGSCP